ncbi:DUF3147 family protein [Streptosporangium amethystogenes subsp. fukuiense]|uniref:DUF3147 family protein n=1 Tax=Streptosporangium amethystogenes subsp. fukuiense TaxID=698418 RepID=A0ABW2SXN4_9ACTN
MSQVWTIALRGLSGGLLVMAFALIGEMVSPKRFAGIFAAGPAVALAGMTVTLLFMGSRQVADSALGMIVGSVALVAYCASAVPLVRRLGALAGSAAAIAVWAAVATAGRLLIA